MPSHQLRLSDVSEVQLLTARSPESVNWSQWERLRDVSAGRRLTARMPSSDTLRSRRG